MRCEKCKSTLAFLYEVDYGDGDVRVCYVCPKCGHKEIIYKEKFIMEKIFARASQGAALGGTIGIAWGTIMAAGATAVTAALCPVSIPFVFAVAGISGAAGGASAGAIGTLIGGGVGATAGTIETIYDNKTKSN